MKQIDPQNIIENFDRFSYAIVAVGFPFLTAALLMGSLWGQVGNKSRKALKLEKKAVVAQLSQVQAEAATNHNALLAKTAKLQKTLQVKDQQLAKARHELVGLRKHNKAFEAQISKRDTALTALIQEKSKLVEQIKKMKKSLQRLPI